MIFSELGYCLRMKPLHRNVHEEGWYVVQLLINGKQFLTSKVSNSVNDN